MSIAASQYHKFADQVAETGSVFTFLQADNYLVFRVHERDVIPFWSSSSRLTRVARMHPKYAEYERQEMPLDEFLAWLPELEEQRIQLGVNWAGKNLTGYDVTPSEVAAMIHHRLKAKSKVVKGPWPRS